MKKVFVLVIFLTLCSAGGYWGYTTYQAYMQKNKGVEQKMAAIPLDFMAVKQSEFFPSLSFVAKMEAKDKVDVRARVTGFLTKRLFNEGDYVNEGQLLFEIEQDQFKANVRSAEATLAKAEANEQNAAAQYKRAKDLFKTKDVSEARLDEREAEYNSAKANIKEAQSALDIAQLNLNYTQIKAPLSGRIGASVYSVGAFIGPESGKLATIVSTTPMYAVFSVSENQILQLRNFIRADIADKEELDISFQNAHGTVYSQMGTLNFIDVELDEQMNTLKIRVSFPNPDNDLIAGQYGRVNMKFKTPQKALLVPSVLVQRDLTGAYVYALSKQNTLERRRIEEGLELTSGETIIEKGLKAGDKVLVNNFQKAAYMVGAPIAPTIVSAQTILTKQGE